MLTCPQTSLGVAFAVVEVVARVTIYFSYVCDCTCFPLKQRQTTTQADDVSTASSWNHKADFVLWNDRVSMFSSVLSFPFEMSPSFNYGTHLVNMKFLKVRTVVVWHYSPNQYLSLTSRRLSVGVTCKQQLAREQNWKFLLIFWVSHLFQ